MNCHDVLKKRDKTPKKLRNFYVGYEEDTRRRHRIEETCPGVVRLKPFYDLQNTICTPCNKLIPETKSS